MSEVSDVTVVQVFFLTTSGWGKGRTPGGSVAFVIRRLAFPLVN